MFSLFLLWIGAPILLRSRGNLVLENLVLRQQLAVLKRRHRRPSLGLLDKFFWVVVRRFWSGWKRALIENQSGANGLRFQALRRGAPIQRRKRLNMARSYIRSTIGNIVVSC